MRLVTLDVESFWSPTYSLSKMSPLEYVMGDEFELISLGIKVDDHPTDVFFGEDDIRAKLIAVHSLWDNAFAIAHNISFDEKILGAECLRLGHPHPLFKKPLRCTMKEATRFCALPGRYGDYKYPNLTELHRKLFQRAFADAHDALADVRACKAAYYELRALGVMG